MHECEKGDLTRHSKYNDYAAIDLMLSCVSGHSSEHRHSANWTIEVPNVFLIQCTILDLICGCLQVSNLGELHAMRSQYQEEVLLLDSIGMLFLLITY